MSSQQNVTNMAIFSVEEFADLRAKCVRATTVLDARKLARLAEEQKIEQRWTEWQAKPWIYRMKNRWVPPEAIDPYGWVAQRERRVKTEIVDIAHAIDLGANQLRLSTDICFYIETLAQELVPTE